VTTSQTLAARILTPVARTTTEGLARLGLEPDPGRWEEDEPSGVDDIQVLGAPATGGYAPLRTGAPGGTGGAETLRAPGRETRPDAVRGVLPSPALPASSLLAPFPWPAAPTGYQPLHHVPFDSTPSQGRGLDGSDNAPASFSGWGAPDPTASGSRPDATRAGRYAPLSSEPAARAETGSSPDQETFAGPTGATARPSSGNQALPTGYQSPHHGPPGAMPEDQERRRAPPSPAAAASGTIGGYVPLRPDANGGIASQAGPRASGEGDRGGSGGNGRARPREAPLASPPPGHVPAPGRGARADATFLPPAARSPDSGTDTERLAVMPHGVAEAATLAPGLIPVRPAALAETGSWQGQARPGSASSRGDAPRPVSQPAGRFGQPPSPVPPSPVPPGPVPPGPAPLRPVPRRTEGLADYAPDPADWAEDALPDNTPMGGSPRVRSTLNVTVAMNGAAMTSDALSGAVDPATREALRDALTEILRDSARRQGIDL